MLATLRKHIRRLQFEPGWAGPFVNPFYLARAGLWDAVSGLGGQVRGKTLDIGCGRKPYRDLFRASEYIGLELDTPENRATKAADVYYDGVAFPFADASFDSVVCNQVLEHVFEPDRFLGEISRVLKQHGTLLLSVPFAWDEHEQPLDFARYSSFGLRYLLTSHGFAVVGAKKATRGVAAVFQLLSAYLYKITVRRNPYLNLLLTATLMAPFNILGGLLSKALPAQDDLYLDNVVLARKETLPDEKRV